MQPYEGLEESLRNVHRWIQCQSEQSRTNNCVFYTQVVNTHVRSGYKALRKAGLTANTVLVMKQTCALFPIFEENGTKSKSFPPGSFLRWGVLHVCCRGNSFQGTFLSSSGCFPLEVARFHRKDFKGCFAGSLGCIHDLTQGELKALFFFFLSFFLFFFFFFFYSK